MNGISETRCVKLYDDINVYNKKQIYSGCGDISDAGKYSNKVGSMEIPTRTCADLHSEKNYKGEMRTFCNYSYQRNKIFDRLGVMDDRMNSMRVYEIRGD